MGITIQNNDIVIKDGDGNTRFSTARRMPHLILVASGTWNVGNVVGSSSWSYYSDESGSGYNRASFNASTVARTTVLSDSRIITGSGRSFVSPFFSMNNGIFTTAAGQVMAGLGSSIVHLFIRNDGYFAGSMIVNTELSAGKVELVARAECSVPGNYTIDSYGYSDSGDPANGSTTTTLNGTGVTIGYKVYYGRFT
jgi:hypothetical protein